MAPRAYWKGSLKLSLVSCPIALYPASTQAEKTHFHQINTKTGHRLKQQMVDEQTGRVVDKDHKGRGYELSKGRYVEIAEEELAAVKLDSTHTIEIDDFVPAEDIDDPISTNPIISFQTAKRERMRSSLYDDATRWLLRASSSQTGSMSLRQSRWVKGCWERTCATPMNCATRTTISTASPAPGYPRT
jgi:hypothetical protein